jgi:[ribosomal protein S5]-alanine N-acetyltransferase
MLSSSRAVPRSRLFYSFTHDMQYAHWGKGYATEVVYGMLKFGFNEMALHRIEADCNQGNIGSMRVLEKAGFTCGGLWRERIWERGTWVSLKQYAILKRGYRG